MNPRTSRPVGYAFVDLKNAEDAQKAIDNLSGSDILDRKVSVQLARKPEAEGFKTENGETAQRKRSTGRGRGGRGRGRGGRTTSGRGVKTDATTTAETVPDEAEVLPLQDKTNEANQATSAATGKPRAPRQPKQRGPPEDGIPSTTKVMVANLPYDLTEDKVSKMTVHTLERSTNRSCSFRNCSPTTSLPQPRLPFAPSHVSWSRNCKPVTSRERVVVSVS